MQEMSPAHRGQFLPPVQADNICALVFPGPLVKSVNVPADARFVVFGADAPFAAKIGGAAAWPAADLTDGSASEINPTIRRLTEGDATIGIATNGPAVVSLSFYR